MCTFGAASTEPIEALTNIPSAMAACSGRVKGEEERNGNGNAWLAGPLSFPYQ